ncbi:MAG: alpha/beta hydrolase [Propionibacteriaceae bacterium]|jgi:alpha-beta hydrolase superfamily lysophospholipase|nr:alpha/beta hydrolase [Propionibacteriaceae bacterium]
MMVIPANNGRSPATVALISKWRALIRRDDSVETELASPAETSTEPGWWADQWLPDRYLDGYETLAFHMPGQLLLPEEGDGYLTATLIRSEPDQRDRAVLYLHGWNEYFFQDHVAQAWQRLGYDFYALDFHRYGRNLRSGQLPGYAESVADYFEEIDAAIARLRQTHRYVVINAHSTGGLIASLWANARPGQLVGLVLNAPWLDLSGSLLSRTLTQAASKALAGKAATWEIPRSESDIYIHSLHQAFNGRWSFDLSLKRPLSSPIRPGWLNAIVRAQDQVRQGLAIDVPVLVVLSSQSTEPKQLDEPTVATTDVIVDVDRVAAQTIRLGWHVSLVRLDGAVHDVALSDQPVRERYFDEIRRWDLAYTRGRQAQQQALDAADEGQTPAEGSN